ncbi:hypothetical protein [Veronia nyctiphanis]|nr:hypothetical protein [Veronia nyctiphanis]
MQFDEASEAHRKVENETRLGAVILTPLRQKETIKQQEDNTESQLA